ncbi:MAG: heat-shock protein [Bdellovibrionaceae bacterium]|nr:heat-shock protein [Pseudobdellovibrionaceae bacterium]
MKSTSTKVWIFIFVTSLIFLLIGYQLAERLGLFVAFLLALGFNFALFFFGQPRLLKSFSSEILRGQDPWGLTDFVAEKSRELSVPEPEIRILDCESASAFVLNLIWHRPVLALTRGLLQRYSRQELEAAIVHRLCHLHNTSSAAFTISGILANAILRIGGSLDCLWIGNFFPGRPSSPFSTLLSPLAWLIVRLVTRDKTFFIVDEMSARIIDDRDRIGRLLWRLESESRVVPMSIPAGTGHLFIVNPERGKQRNPLLLLQPATELRIRKLMGYYPL